MVLASPGSELCLGGDSPSHSQKVPHLLLENKELASCEHREKVGPGSVEQDAARRMIHGFLSV